MKKFAWLCVGLLLFAFYAVAQETEQQGGQEPETVTNIVGTSSEGLTIFKSGKFALELDGRLQLVWDVYKANLNPLGSGTEARRARLAFKPTWGDWTGQFDVNFAGNAVEIKDFWVAYTGFDHFILKAGNQKTQWSLEEVTSSRYITFIERASLNAFTPDRRVGFSVANWHKNWRIFGGIFGQGVEDVDETGVSEQLGYNFRLTAAPLLVKDNVIHLGASMAHVRPSAGSDTVKFSSRPESHVTMNKFLNTGKIGDLRSWDAYGLEFAAVKGPVLLQSEYTWVNVNRLDLIPRVRLSGYYAYIAWRVTGENRPYNSEEGEVGWRTIPKNKKLGTIELAARYSNTDMNDTAAEVFGGKEQNITFAANWFPYANLKISLNYIHTINDAFATGDGDFLPNDKFNTFATAIMFLF